MIQLFSALGTLLLLVLMLWFFFRIRRALPVLMYHKVDPRRQDELTVSVSQLEAQLGWLRAHEYRSVSLREVLEALRTGQALPPRSVLLTFDDAYRNNLIYALPLLQRYGYRATIFVPTAYVGGRNEWDGGGEPLLSADELRGLDSATVELALHTHTHGNFKHLPIEAIRQEIVDNMAAFRRMNLPVVPALAYPYGGRPKDRPRRTEMETVLAELGIEAAFRIGNRLNGWPIRNRYQLQRLDIRGTHSLARFAQNVRWGKLI